MKVILVICFVALARSQDAMETDCNFNSGMCSWNQVYGTDQFDWSRRSGSTPSSATGPSSGHKGNGSYIYIEASSPRRKGQKAILESAPGSYSSNDRCFTFYYHMYGSTMGELIFRVDAPWGYNHTKWVLSGNQGNQWKYGSFPLPKYLTNYTVSIIGVVGSSYTGDIALDDIKVVPSRCSVVPAKAKPVIKTTQRPSMKRPTTRQTTRPSTRKPTTVKPTTIKPTSVPSLLKADCDFNLGMCSWKQVYGTDQFNWSRKSGSTPSIATGPSSGHRGNGSYIYIEASSPRTKGQKAILESAPGSYSSNDRCFTFYYHMYGSTMGELIFRVDAPWGYNHTKWVLSGNQGNQWQYGSFPLPKYLSNYTVSIIGVVGSSYTGDIALDDIKVVPGRCSVVPAKANPVIKTTQRPSTKRPTTRQTTRPSTRKPTTVKPTSVPSPLKVDCSFDKDTCNWNNIQGDQFDWTRQFGGTSSSSTGPTSDRSGRGYYMYTETSSPRQLGDKALLESSPLDDSCHDRCFTFYYNMYGTNIGSLSVLLRSNGKDTLLWELKGNQGTGWQLGRAKILGTAPQNATVVFSGVRGNGYMGDIGLDDIVMVEKLSCGVYPAAADPNKHATTRPPTRPATTTPPPPTKPPVSQADCDFQNGMCSLSNERGGDVFDWSRLRGQTGSSNTGPSVDHTTGNSSGFYLYIETSSPRKQGDNAVLSTPFFVGSSRPTCFEFWYHMYGATIGELKVKLDTMSGKDVLWVLKGQQGNSWMKAFVPIPPQNGTYKLLMEGIAGSSFTGDIALDDLKMSYKYCQLSPSQARPTTPPPPPPPTPTIPPCRDLDSSCPSLAKYCNVSFLSSCVRTKCLKTCGLCDKGTPKPPTPPPGSCGISPVPHSRVIGGKDAKVGAWPWQAALRTSSSGRFFCGGSLINNQWILTAAHCIGSSSTSYYKITLGDHDRNRNEGTEKDYTVSKVFKHPNYHTGAPYNNDAALMKLSTPVMITKRISPVCLPAKHEVVAVGTNCYITGWGKIRHPGSSHNILQQALMPIRGKQECADRLAKSPNGSRLKITDQMVCAGYTSSSSIVSGCHGDSGGPLVCQKPTGEFQLHGAVSWGSPRCSVRERFTVFARLTAIRDWIDQTVASN